MRVQYQLLACSQPTGWYSSQDAEGGAETRRVGDDLKFEAGAAVVNFSPVLEILSRKVAVKWRGTLLGRFGRISMSSQHRRDVVYQVTASEAQVFLSELWRTRDSLPVDLTVLKNFSGLCGLSSATPSVFACLDLRQGPGVSLCFWLLMSTTPYKSRYLGFAGRRDKWILGR